MSPLGGTAALSLLNLIHKKILSSCFFKNTFKDNKISSVFYTWKLTKYGCATYPGRTLAGNDLFKINSNRVMCNKIVAKY